MPAKSYWIAGFECSCHRRQDGRRLDVIAATGHDLHRWADYSRLRESALETARDGARWHLIEPAPGRYDLSSLLPMVRAARETGIQVIWDLCHYGWPDGLDVFAPEWVERFTAYARVVAQAIREETGEPGFYCPINEISFWSWAGGDAGYLNPFATRRGFELKAQLARATVSAIEAIWSVDPGARFLQAEPVIHIVGDPQGPDGGREAEGHRLAQFQAWDMIAGRLWPQLGGSERYLDVVGVNFYPPNQWVHGGPVLSRTDPGYRPFREILEEVWQRYGRPILISETGAQGAERAPWLRYVGEEARAARRAGVPVEGICLYPILDYPGWDDDRHCETGLWGYADPSGHREICFDLAQEMACQDDLRRRETPAGWNPGEIKEMEEMKEIEHASPG